MVGFLFSFSPLILIIASRNFNFDVADNFVSTISLFFFVKSSINCLRMSRFYHKVKGLIDTFHTNA